MKKNPTKKKKINQKGEKKEWDLLGGGRWGGTRGRESPLWGRGAAVTTEGRGCGDVGRSLDSSGGAERDSGHEGTSLAMNEGTLGTREHHWPRMRRHDWP